VPERKVDTMSFL